MKVAFDSSVVIAGTHDVHPHHRRAIVWIDAVLEQRITGVIAQNRPFVSSVVCSRFSNSANWSPPFMTKHSSGAPIGASPPA